MTYSPFQENEISEKAFGGTELAKNLLKKVLDPELLSNFQIICSRLRDLDESKIRLFWCHDLPSDTEAQFLKDEYTRNKFHNLLFISQWQYQQYQNYLGVPFSIHCNVLESGIEPAKANPMKWGKPETINIVYTSTPQRGLGILVPVFEKLQEKYKEKIHLDVFSSFKIYGWSEYDKQFEPIYERCRNNSGISYHGFKPHDEVLDYLEKKGHIFAYPSIWQECQCRALIEAMSAQLLCVHPNYAALPDTSASLNIMYQGDQDQLKHANIFVNVLDQAIGMASNIDNNFAGRLNFNKTYVDSRYNIGKIKVQWESLLRQLLNAFPTPESRKFPSEMFNYKS
jgi:UDP-glucose:(glucosyl)LPS alpha-1,2-glucosyltransferase